MNLQSETSVTLGKRDATFKVEFARKSKYGSLPAENDSGKRRVKV